MTNRFIKSGIAPAIATVLTLVISLACPHQSIAGTPEDDFDEAAMQIAIRNVVEQASAATVGITEQNDGMITGGFSGVIISVDGLVLSAAHAIQPGDEYRVTLYDGREVTARGLGREPNIDCAMLQITDSGEWPAAPMGWSFDLKENQPCVSISHPGELNTERGPVVRFGRIADPSSGINGFICSTCLMEPGDSGGPLFDMNGRVIGIHSMIQESEEENYDVPIDAFRRFWPELNAEKTFRARSVQRGPSFGMRLIRSRNASGQSYDSQPIGGVRVFRVEEDSIAGLAGLQRNDRIIKVNSQRVLSSYEIENTMFGLYSMGADQLELTVERDGKRIDLQLDVPDIDGEDGSFIADRESKLPTVEPVAELARIESEFSEIEEQLDDYSALVTSRKNGRTSRGMATVISSVGIPEALQSVVGEGSLLVGKSSLVSDHPVATLENSTRMPLEVLARDEDNDLVLLYSKTKIADGVSLTAVAGDDGDLPGEFLISPNPRNDGTISVVGSSLFKCERLESSGFFGVFPEFQNGKVVLGRVVPDQAARKAGFQRGDVIETIAGEPIDSPEALSEQLGKFLPGDEVVISATRDGEPIEKTVELGLRPNEGMHVAEDFEGGKSERRDGFDEVFVQGAVVTPRECGGPVFDIDKTFRGINISRFSRTRCYVLPARLIRQFVDDAAGNVQQ